jgi:hypothetical protein
MQEFYFMREAVRTILGSNLSGDHRDQTRQMEIFFFPPPQVGHYTMVASGPGGVDQWWCSAWSGLESLGVNGVLLGIFGGSMVYFWYIENLFRYTNHTDKLSMPKLILSQTCVRITYPLSVWTILFSIRIKSCILIRCTYDKNLEMIGSSH